MFSRFSARACGVSLFAGILALSAACGPNYKNRAIVKGKVTFGGQTLTTGNVMFYGKDNISASASIDKDGNYVMNDAPVGDVTITVTVPKPPPGGIGMIKKGAAFGDPDSESAKKGISIMGNMPDNVVPISEKYATVESSPLKYKVEKGEHTHNLELTP